MGLKTPSSHALEGKKTHQKVELNLDSREEIADQLFLTLFSQNKHIEKTGHTRLMLCDLPLRQTKREAYDALCMAQLFPTDENPVNIVEQNVTRAYWYSSLASLALHSFRRPNSWRTFVPFVLDVWKLGSKNTDDLVGSFDRRIPAVELDERYPEYEALNRMSSNISFTALVNEGEKTLLKTRDYAQAAIYKSLDDRYGPRNPFSTHVKEIIQKSSNGVVFAYAYVLSLAQDEDIFVKYARGTGRANRIKTGWAYGGIDGRLY